MVAKNQYNNPYNYRYAGEANDIRTDEYRFVKYFNLITMIAYLISSIWIFIFIFYQADWEMNLHYENARVAAGITTWKWCTVFSVILADILALVFLTRAIWAENKYQLLTLSLMAYGYSMWGIFNVYLRGSIVCFVLPFTVATLSVIQFTIQRNEDKDFKMSQELRVRPQQGPPATMETFLDDHEKELEKF